MELLPLLFSKRPLVNFIAVFLKLEPNLKSFAKNFWIFDGIQQLALAEKVRCRVYLAASNSLICSHFDKFHFLEKYFYLFLYLPARCICVKRFSETSLKKYFELGRNNIYYFQRWSHEWHCKLV